MIKKLSFLLVLPVLFSFVTASIARADVDSNKIFSMFSPQAGDVWQIGGTYEVEWDDDVLEDLLEDYPNMEGTLQLAKSSDARIGKQIFDLNSETLIGSAFKLDVHEFSDQGERMPEGVYRLSLNVFYTDAAGSAQHLMSSRVENIKLIQATDTQEPEKPDFTDFFYKFKIVQPVEDERLRIGEQFAIEWETEAFDVRLKDEPNAQGWLFLTSQDKNSGIGQTLVEGISSETLFGGGIKASINEISNDGRTMPEGNYYLTLFIRNSGGRGLIQSLSQNIYLENNEKKAETVSIHREDDDVVAIAEKPIVYTNPYTPEDEARVDRFVGRFEKRLDNMATDDMHKLIIIQNTQTRLNKWALRRKEDQGIVNLINLRLHGLFTEYFDSAKTLDTFLESLLQD